MKASPSRPLMVITGSSRGIGRGMAAYFIAKGYRVAGCSRGPSDYRHAYYQHTQVDVGDSRQVRSWIRKVKSDFQRIDALVCNAGVVGSALMMTVTPDDILTTVLRTQFEGTYYVCREVSKAMLSAKQGRIVTISSLGVPLHLEGTSVYSAAKSAIVEMTKILAKELAPAGILCNSVSPSLIMTPAAEAMGKPWAANLLAKQTIKRTATVDELCRVVEFFVTPENRCITGQVMHMGLVD